MCIWSKNIQYKTCNAEIIVWTATSIAYALCVHFVILFLYSAIHVVELNEGVAKRDEMKWEQIRYYGTFVQNFHNV